MQVTMFIVAVVGFPIAGLTYGMIREFRKNRANNKPTLLEIHTVIGYKLAVQKGERKYKKSKHTYDILKNLEK